MKIKTIAWVLITTLAVFLLWLPATAQNDPEPIVDGVFNPDWVKKIFAGTERPVSAFPHDEHTSYESAPDCYVCHHVYENGKRLEDDSSEGQACAECHPAEAGSGTTRLLSSYHNLCKKCHEEQSQGPLTCGECHVK